MNYEELIESRDSRTLRIAKFPIGVLYKQLVDKKYCNVVKLREDLKDNIIIDGDIEYEGKKNIILNNRHLLHFNIIRDKSNAVVGLMVEQGNFISVSELFLDNPSAVATPDSIHQIVHDLLGVTSYLHSQNIFHVCFSPESVLCRKGTNSILLLSHGSFYKNRASLIFSDYADFVAPEVLSNAEIDSRSDIYSLGKFIESLFVFSEMPITYRKVIDRATKENPEERYQSVRDMQHDLRNMSRLYKTLISVAVVLVVLGLGTFFWIDAHSDQTSVEYVKPAPKEPTDDLLDDGFNAQTELGVVMGDSTYQMTPQQKQQQKIYEKKVESIFRAQFAKKANVILDKIYNKTYMSASEKKFMTASQNTTNELMKAQMEIGQKAGLNDAVSQRIASDIVEKLTQQKMKVLKGEQSY
jgi:serine/threonine protein kinase